MSTVAEKFAADYDEMKRQKPPELEWARLVVRHFTTFSTRSYGGGAAHYCYAEMDVVDPATGRQELVDPYPSRYYPRGVLLAQLTLRKQRNPGLAIATPVSF